LKFFSNSRNHLALCAIFAFELDMNKRLPSFSSETELIAACRQNNRQAQQFLFQKMAGKMLSVIKRYVINTSEAEDTLMEGFVKVFAKLDQFQGGGSFEGWIRKIMVNEALMSIRKNKDRFPMDIEVAFDLAHPDETFMQLNVQEIESLIATLPTGYRTIFNLYAIEGYSHAEIALLLNISEGTSKSQLSRARAILQNQLITLQL
jgi:RNA polymerase sigma-70 factor (ECF subfamily)